MGVKLELNNGFIRAIVLMVSLVLIQSLLAPVGFVSLALLIGTSKALPLKPRRVEMALVGFMAAAFFAFAFLVKDSEWLMAFGFYIEIPLLLVIFAIHARAVVLLLRKKRLAGNVLNEDVEATQRQ